MKHPLPGEATELYARLLRAPPAAARDLTTMVRCHLATATQRHEADAFVDIGLATAIGEACLALLEGFDQADPDQGRAIQAACVYFAAADDAEDDFSSVLGFDDDAGLLNHVAELLDRPDLIIPL